MTSNQLFWYQRENIEKLINKVLNMDFTDINEVRYFKRHLNIEISKNVDFHVNLHLTIENAEDIHECKEFEKKEKFGRRLIRILDETIEELENA